MQNLATLVPLVDEARGLLKVYDTGTWAHINVKLLHLSFTMAYRKHPKKGMVKEYNFLCELLLYLVSNSLLRYAWIRSLLTKSNLSDIQTLNHCISGDSSHPCRK